MITTPNRLLDAIAARERGERIDARKLADLQALDLAVIGRQFMEEAVQHHEAETAALEQALKGEA